jgi:DNA polymerase III delta prime subunit
LKVENNLLLHPATKKHLLAFISSPSNSLLISGQPGAGKKTIANTLSARLLDVDIGRLPNHPYFFTLRRPENKSEIPIDDIRALIKKTNLRVSSANPINRVALIEDSEYLSTEAQNALLKLLEEPPLGTVLILTAASEDKLLATIVSRVQRLYVLPPSLSSSLEFFSAYPKSEVQSSWRLAKGGAGLQSALLAESTEHPLKQAVEDAKTFIKLDKYQRLLMAQQLAKDRQKTLVFLEALSRILSALQSDAADKHRTRISREILAARQAIERQHNYAAANVNSRLSSLAMALDISL